MKKTLSLLSLAVLTIGLLGSCSKINERIDDLEGRIDRIESDRIASIDQQIAAINSSISDLGTIRQNIQNLIDTTDGQEKDINSLKTADASLGQRIDELKAYTDETLKAYAKSDWVKATFATLEQHEWTCDTVAKIDARIGKLDKNLSESIKDSEESLRSWVNAQMESYYTAAQMDAKLAELLSKITTASGESQAKADSLAKELKEAKSAIVTVKTELTEAYQSAIEKAIKTSEGKLSSRISSSVSSVNSKVSSLADRVDDLEGKVDGLTNRIKDLEGRIQSVTIIPDYNDGSIKYGDDENSLTINCIISPSSLVANLTQSAFTVLYREVKTKSGDNTLTITGFSKDQTSGIVTLNANIPTGVPASGKSLFVAVNVRNDESDLTTNFVPVYTPASAPATFKAVYDTNGGANTLTFYYDANDHSGDGITVYDNLPTAATGNTSWGYNSVRSNIKKVEIKESVKNYKGLTSTACMFQGMTYASSISGAEHLDVSNVTDMSSMFYGFGFSSNSLTDIPNVTDWQTGNVTNMNSLFYGYGIGSGSLAEVPDVSNWNTAKVKNMSNMFNQYGKSSTVLTKVPIVNGSNWDTGEVTNMSGMFQSYGYTSEVLVEVPDVSEWNTAKVEDMSNMFYGYAYHSKVLTKVPTVNGSNWDTKAVTNMSCMFQEYGYTSTDLKAVPQVGNWNTEIVTKMGKMFYNYGYCSVSLAEVPDVSNWNTASVTDMSYMFNSFAHNSTALTIVPRVDGSNWKTENLKDIDYMFQYYGNSAENICCELDLSGWNLANLSEGEGSNVFNFEPKNFNVTIPAKTGAKSNEGNKWYYGNGTNYIAPPAGKTFTLEYVEIGGLKWATMNLGAEKVTDYGDYFAWGETAPYYEGTGGWPATSTWKSGKASGYAWQSYCGSSSFSEWSTPPYDATTKILKPEFDAAAQILGNGWRMPTSAEFQALYDACLNGSYDTTTNPSGASASVGKGVYWCTNYDGVAGCLFCDGTNKLFFPATGYGNGNSNELSNAGSYGYYWSSTLYPSDTTCAWRMFFYNTGFNSQHYTYRYWGHSVRPVKDAAPVQ